VAIDLSALAHKTVKIWADRDLLFCFAENSLNTELIFEGSLPASRSALKADQAAANIGVFRGVLKQYPWLIVSTVSGTTTVHIKRV
jgi:hypothetical protein